jgi:hypothetical protein
VPGERRDPLRKIKEFSRNLSGRSDKTRMRKADFLGFAEYAQRLDCVAQKNGIFQGFAGAQ